MRGIIEDVEDMADIDWESDRDIPKWEIKRTLSCGCQYFWSPGVILISLEGNKYNLLELF